MTTSLAPEPELDLSDAEMPDNDNDSDRDSLFTANLAGEDSPVDGYFESREHPQESFVLHSSVQAESEAKAREAARERMAAAQSSNSHPPTSQHSSSAIPTPTSRSSRSASQWEDDSNPAVDTTAPPPDYETAISDRSSERNSNRVASPVDAQGPRSPTEYGTMSHQADNAYRAEDSNEAQWPFGNRGNPFASGNFPFGNSGNPFSNGNFTFGNRGNQFGLHGNPFGFRGNPFGFRGNPVFGNRGDRSSSNDNFNTREEPIGPAFYPARFGQDHPLVRNGLFSGQQGSGYGTQPESMADRGFSQSYHNDGDEEVGLLDRSGRRPQGQRHRPGEWRRSASQRLRNSSRSAYRSCRSWGICAAVLVLVLLVVLIGRGVYTVTRGTESGSIGDGSGEGNGENSDYDLPHNDSWPVNPPYTPDLGNRFACRWSEAQAATAAFEKPKKFSFIEMLERKQDGPQQIWGEVRIRPAPQIQEEAIVAVVSIRTSHEWEVQGVNIDMDDSGLELKYPSLHRKSSSIYRGCMAIGVALQVRSDVTLQDFEVSVAHMKVNILDGLFRDKRGTERWPTGPKITHSTKITTVDGGVHAEYWNSRETWIDSGSGRVSGSFALLDVLNIHTTNGEIDINVQPKEVDKENPQPAVLTLESRNGAIKAESPTHGEIPPRDYQTRVDTANGGARGTYILGSSATFTSSNGEQKLTVLPYDTKVKSLQTHTKNGGTTLKFLSPYAASSQQEGGNIEKTDLSNLQSSHKSDFGSVTLQYPQEWMGTIDAQSTFGSVHVHGKDIEQITVPTSSKHIVVHKGQGDSKLTVRTTGGSIDVLAGDES